MTTLEIILTAVASLLGIITGGQSLLFYRQSKKMKKLENEEKEIDNEAKVSDGWQEYCNELKGEKKELKDEMDIMKKEHAGAIEKLEKTISDYRDKYYACREEKEALKVENVKLTLMKCEVPSCPSRKPPSGY